jgi:hypothetical protein
MPHLVALAGGRPGRHLLHRGRKKCVRRDLRLDSARPRRGGLRPSPFSGGKRILVDRLVTRRQAIAIAATFYALGGRPAWRSCFRDPAVLAIAAAGVVSRVLLPRAPPSCPYRGLGELAVAVTYGR